MHAVTSKKGAMFFLYGYGGIEKTFMWKILVSALHSQRKMS